MKTVLLSRRTDEQSGTRPNRTHPMDAGEEDSDARLPFHGRSMMLAASDPRGAKAVAIATDAGQWLKCRTRNGRKAYGIRSIRDASHVYFVTRTHCTCPDAIRHTCKHQLAVQLHCALVEEQRTATKYEVIFKRFEGE
jgi:hypothetical protein